MIATEIATVGITRITTEQQHLAERDAEQTGKRERADTGNREHDPAFEADRHRGRHPGGAVAADLLGEVAGQRRGDDEQDVEEDRLERGGDRQRHRIGHSLGSEHLQQRLHQTLDGAGLLQDGAHQHAEGDQQADLGHDVAEPVVIASIVSCDAEPDRQAEVGGSDDQRDDRIELEPHDHHDHRDDRDRRVDDDCGM